MRDMLTAARDLWRSSRRHRGARATGCRAGRITFRLIHIADIVAVTGGVGLALCENGHVPGAIRAVR